ncbi:MAG: hypothetical protein U9Q16_00245 [Patescibacteria group bacterium]|nr:hypothetical protein [Patescibacteria group bacterium]
MDKKLENYIKLSRKTGLNDEQIKKELLESKAGWTEEDINQAFNPNASSTNSQTPKPKSFWKYISILGIVVVLGAVSSFGYYYFYVDSDRNNDEETNENNGTDVPVSKTPGDGIENCGITEFLAERKDDLLTGSDELAKEANKDETLTCLGNNILDNCKKSEAIFRTTDMGDIKFTIEGGENNICNIKREYGEREQIQIDDQKRYANTYISCPIHVDYFLENEFREGRDQYEIPGILPISMYLYFNSVSFAPDEFNCISDFVYFKDILTPNFIHEIKKDIGYMEEDPCNGFANCEDNVIDVTGSSECTYFFYGGTQRKDPYSRYYNFTKSKDKTKWSKLFTLKIRKFDPGDFMIIEGNKVDRKASMELDQLLNMGFYKEIDDCYALNYDKCIERREIDGGIVTTIKTAKDNWLIEAMYTEEANENNYVISVLEKIAQNIEAQQKK